MTFANSSGVLVSTSKPLSSNALRALGVEIAEMQAFVSGRVEQAQLKSFITRRFERFRTPYAKRVSKFPRTCVFIGTTNETDWIKDPTGGRRFWPVKCDAVNLERLTRERDQLFAEAVQRVRDGEPWHPSLAFQQDYIDLEQQSRTEPDEWEEKTDDFLSSTITSRDGIKLEEMYMKLNLGNGKPFDQRDALRIGRILKRLGWINKPLWVGHPPKRKRRWVHKLNPYHNKVP